MGDRGLQPSPNPFLFVVGCPRSGTTLLQRLIDAHPKIAVPNREQHWIPRAVNRGWLGAGDAATRELLATLQEDKRFRHMVPDEGRLQSLADRLPMPYAEFVARVFDLHGALQGKPLVGEKTPHHVRSIPLLHGLWPHARFVHLIRDGRDVALSIRDWSPKNRPGKLPTWDEDPIPTAAVAWDRMVRRGIEDGGALGPSLYHEVRYERLVADPAAECERLCEFLGVEFDDAMLRFHEGRERSDPGLNAKKAWRPVTPGLRDWQTDLEPEELEAFEVVAGELLERLGYPRAAHQPSSRANQRADRVIEAAGDWLVRSRAGAEPQTA